MIKTKYFDKNGKETTPQKSEYAVELNINKDGTIKSSKTFFRVKRK